MLCYSCAYTHWYKYFPLSVYTPLIHKIHYGFLFPSKLHSEMIFEKRTEFSYYTIWNKLIEYIAHFLSAIWKRSYACNRYGSRQLSTSMRPCFIMHILLCCFIVYMLNCILPIILLHVICVFCVVSQVLEAIICRNEPTLRIILDFNLLYFCFILVIIVSLNVSMSILAYTSLADVIDGNTKRHKWTFVTAFKGVFSWWRHQMETFSA